MQRDFHAQRYIIKEYKVGGGEVQLFVCQLTVDFALHFEVLHWGLSVPTHVTCTQYGFQQSHLQLCFWDLFQKKLPQSIYIVIASYESNRIWQIMKTQLFCGVVNSSTVLKFFAHAMSAGFFGFLSSVHHLIPSLLHNAYVTKPCSNNLNIDIL